MYGFHGNVLHIDLAHQTTSIEAIPDDILKSYLGGKGLGTYLLLKHLPAGVDPLSGANCLVFATGPATDTVVPAASRFGVYAKSPLTGFLGESYSGGHVPPVMKRTGYDAFVIKGVAEAPVFLHISDRGVSFEAADDLWGQPTDVAERALLDRVDDPKAQALVIGPAGENQVRFACIKNNQWRSAGRSGLGAVMGAKRLKGLVFSGKQRAALADPDALDAYTKSLIAEYRDHERTRRMKKYGTPYMTKVTNREHAFPTRYWSAGRLEGWEGLSAERMHEVMDVRPNACYRCFMACGKMSRVTKGRHKGLTLEGPEYETIFALGGICGINEIEEVAYLNDLCDKLGIDTISAGNLAAFGIEAGKRGVLHEQAQYGDADAIARVFQAIAHRKGEGDLLAQGVREAARAVGLEDIAVHVKGMDPAGYDPRRLRGMSLGYAVSSRGACHLRSSYYMEELSGMAPEDTSSRTARFVMFESRNALEDSLVLCRFYQQFIGWSGMKTIIEATTGMACSHDDLQSMGRRLTTLAKHFNLREGWTRSDDNLPRRIFEEPIGPNEEFRITRDEFEAMLAEYYRLHGWNLEGIPPEHAQPLT